MLVTHSRDGKTGPWALQHHGWREAGYSLDWRTCIIATRVTARDIGEATDDAAAGEGGYDLDNRATGDLTNVFAWPGSLKPEPQGRAAAGFSWAWATTVVKAPPETDQGNQASSPERRDDVAEEPMDMDAAPALADPEANDATIPDTSPSEPSAAAGGGVSDALTATGQKPRHRFHLLPIRNDRYEPDTRYDAVTMTAVTDKKGHELGSRYPIGTRGVMLAGSEENEQFAIFMPCENRLFAVNFAGEPLTGTIVADLNDDDTVALDRLGRLNSIFRVAQKPCWQGENGAPVEFENVVALNMAPFTGRQDSPASIWYLGANCWSNAAWGGPFIGPEPYCQHVQCLSHDGTQNAPLHLTTWTLFEGYGPGALANAQPTTDGTDGVNDATGDGPLLFEGRFPKVKKGPYKLFVHLEWDPNMPHSFPSATGARGTGGGGQYHGVWRWWAESFQYEPEPPTDNPPTDTPPPTRTPPGEPGQPTYPGKIPPDEPDPEFGFIPQPDIWDPILRQKMGLPLFPETVSPLGPNGPIGTPPGSIVPGGNPPAPRGGGADINLPEGTLDEIFNDLKDAPGWWGTLRPEEPPPTLTPHQQGERNRFAATGMMAGFTGQLFRPQYFADGARDMRHWMDPTEAAVRAFDQQAPVVLRLEAYGAQGATAGGPFLSTSTGRQYTTLPRTDRYPSGSGPGGVVYLSPDSDMSQIDQDLLPTTFEAGAAYVVAGPRVFWASGIPDLHTGGVHSGYRWGVDEDGNLSFDRMNPDGTLDFSLVLPTADGDPGDALVTDGAGNLSFAPVSGSTTINALFAATEDAAVTNTTTPTTLIGGGVGSMEIPSDCQVGDSYRVLIRGTFSTKADPKGTTQIIGLVGGIQVLDTGAFNYPNGANSLRPFEIEMIMTCRDISDPTAAVFVGQIRYGCQFGTGTAIAFGDGTWSGTVNITGSPLLDVQWAWGTADANNSIVATISKMDQERPAA